MMTMVLNWPSTT
uniref:Uncharacterized protein n=1 Tax=Arundo donax TaxID=35708 RepID=A0A0A8XZ11_ARUDO